MVGEVRDPQGRFSSAPDAITAARADRAKDIRRHVEHALALYAAPSLHWSRPDFGGVNSFRNGERGVLSGTAFLALNWPGRALFLGLTREPILERAKAPVEAVLAEAEASGAWTALVGSTVAAWVALEQVGAPLKCVYRADRDPAFVRVDKLNEKQGQNE